MLSTAAPAAAECSQLDTWPSFREAARTAKRIIVGEVVAGYSYDSTDRATQFRLRVDELLRGLSDPVIDFRDGVYSGEATICPGDSILRVRIGDVIAFAFDARLSGSSNPVLTVAYVRGNPDKFLMPGIERLTLAEVRAAAGLPATDTITSRDAAPGQFPVVPLLAAALLGGLAFLIRTGGPRQARL